jgi:hypothetical protein
MLEIVGCTQDEPPAPFLYSFPFSSALYGGSNTFEQQLVIEWFGEKLYRPGPHGLKTQILIAVGRDKDGGDLALFSV